MDENSDQNSAFQEPNDPLQNCGQWKFISRFLMLQFDTMHLGCDVISAMVDFCIGGMFLRRHSLPAVSGRILMADGGRVDWW